MPNILDFKTEHGDFSIELIDNPFVDQWLNHFLKMSQKYHTSIRPKPWPWVERGPSRINQHIKQAIDQVISAIELINSLDYITPLPEKICRDQLTPLDLHTQQLLNRLHRYAVVGAENRNKWIMHAGPAFEWVPYENTQFDYAVNLLNQNIHNLERYVSTPHKEKFCAVWKSTEILFDSSKYNDVDIYHDDVDIAISDSMFPYLKLSGFDVWIKKDLLGKDFVTAFSDHDDPEEFDVRPPTMFSGGIQISQDSGKDQLHHSAEFINWLGADPTDFHGNYPLGNVISNKQHITNAKTVEFVGLRNF
jgi:hypothetical protein